ncbi:MAG: hypothetical protein KJN79_01970 [Gammaproteobacteria bacterium]|nr:hypothetical protein [Gammaproteobacteria bacterium]
MLNWDDPLQSTDGTPQPQRAVPPVAPPAEDVPSKALHADRAHAHPHAGDGLVANEILMATAGAAPSVNPDPLPAARPPPTTKQQPRPARPVSKRWRWVPVVFA